MNLDQAILKINTDQLSDLMRFFAACPLPSNPSNGQVNLLGEDTKYGQYISYSCNTGYMLSGSDVRQCRGSQTWSGTTPSCEPVTCARSTDPANGYISYPIGYGVGVRVSLQL